MKKRTGWLLGVLTALGAGNAIAVEFEERTAAAGFTYSGESWGASWGDVNGDGRPDAFISNHRAKPSIYLNQGDGTFSDVAGQLDAENYWGPNFNADTHGGVWADYDNDGDQDLVVTGGGSNGGRSRQFFVNTGGQLFESRDEVNYFPRNGRSVAWMDIDNDGWLDLFSVGNPVGELFVQNQPGALDRTINQFHSCQRNHFVLLADMDDGGRQDLFCAGKADFPQRVHDTSSYPNTFIDITASIPFTVLTQDTVIADLDGDLRPDIFHVRGGKRLSGATLVGSSAIDAQLVGTTEKSFSFEVGGSIDMVISIERQDTVFDVTLDPTTQTSWRFQDGTSDAIDVTFDSATNTWTVTLDNSGWALAAVRVFATAAISNLQNLNQQALDTPKKPSFLRNLITGFTEDLAAAGLNDDMSCISAVAADFDNDMDLDLYLVCREAARNIANRLYENDGSGVFTRVSLAGGAEGALGSATIDGAGTGESVVTADYDSDGFVDLLITNGLNESKERLGGPTQLYRNLGNANNWVELDLEGVTSNRDGIGARVYAVAGGITQLREQNGGYHRWSQNHSRLHFGLADAASVDIEIRWPSGVVDTHTITDVNRVYRALENGGLTEVNPVTEPDPVAELVDWPFVSGGVSATANRLAYSGSPPGWNANGANSAPLTDLGYNDDYSVDFTIDDDPSSALFVIGLGIDETVAGWRDVDYAFRVSSGQLLIYEGSSFIANAGAVAAGDVLSLRVIGGNVEYVVNGIVVASRSFAGTPAFYVDAAFKEGNAAVLVTVTGEPDPVDPPPPVVPLTSWLAPSGGVSQVGDGVSFSGSPTAWSANSINSVPLDGLGYSDDFELSWQIGSDPAGTTWIMGLGASESSNDWRDVDHGLRSSGGVLTVYENGSWRGNFGALAPGDVLAIRVTGTLVQYSRNGSVILETLGTAAPSYYVDSSFRSGAIDLSAIGIAQY